MSDRKNMTPEGVYCRACGSFRCRTIQSRHAREGIIRRRRCMSCKHPFRTIETHYSEKNGSVCSDYPAVASRKRITAT